MSTFLTNFSSYFSEEERKSELYRVLSTIGVNFERVLLEELNAEIRRSTEVSAFSENKLRSLLAFLLTPVRNVISATGIGRVVVNSIKNENNPNGQTFATVPAGAIVSGSNGKEYQIQNDLMLNLGRSTSFSFVQGVESSIGVKSYSEFIAIPVGSGMVDLSYVRVFMSWESGKEIDIPLVPSFPNFPVDLRAFFPDLGSALTGYVGDDPSIWNPLLKNVEAIWDSIQGTSIRPRSGFFPFFFNNTLFIKIFPGGLSDASDYIPDPNGKTVTVNYRISDGASGNLGENQLKSFVSGIETTDGGQVEVTLYNEETFNGVNAPSRAELTNILRKRLFASTHVSSIPEYTAWFLAQPTIGDCLVVSDFLRWGMSGKASFSGFDIKGTVDIYLVDPSGNPIIPKQASVYIPLIKSLNDELNKVKDVSFLNYIEPETYWHFYVVQYRDVSSDVEFTHNALDALFKLYSISWVRNNGSSLFKDLNIDSVTSAIRGESNVTGLRVIPYHYFEKENLIFNKIPFFISLDFHHGERSGGWYEYWEKEPISGELGHYIRNPDDSLTVVNDKITNNFVSGFPCAVFKEYVDLHGFCYIYRCRLDETLNLNGHLANWPVSGLTNGLTLWSRLEDSKYGDRNEREIRFNLVNLAPGVLRCFWNISNEGLVPVGSNVETGNFGIRKLPSDQSLLAGQTFFGESIRFEKYQ